MKKEKKYLTHFRACINKLQIGNAGKIKDTPYEEKYTIMEDKRNKDILMDYIEYIKGENQTVYRMLVENEVPIMVDDYLALSRADKIKLYKIILRVNKSVQ